MTALALDSMQGLFYRSVPPATLSRGVPWYRETSYVNGATGLSNGMIRAATTFKNAKLIKTITYRPSSTSTRTALGF